MLKPISDATCRMEVERGGDDGEPVDGERAATMFVVDQGVSRPTEARRKIRMGHTRGAARSRNALSHEPANGLVNHPLAPVIPVFHPSIDDTSG